MPGIIAPRKAVNEVQKLLEDLTQDVAIEISTAKARFQFGDVVLTTKLIDGTFPDYARVIPTGNDKRLVVDKEPFERAVDRVSTLSSERGRAIKLAIAEGKMTLSVNNPDSGSASEEIEADYDSAPIDIGFNARYLLDIVGQLSSDTALIRLGRSWLPDPHPGSRRRAGAFRADAAQGVSASLTGAPLPGCRSAHFVTRLNDFSDLSALLCNFFRRVFLVPRRRAAASKDAPGGANWSHPSRREASLRPQDEARC